MFKRLLLITGLAALIGYFLRRQHHTESKVEGYADPADELRQKLDEARSRDAAEADSELSDDLDARRREVHEKARASADEMRGSSSD
jgi:hypothetical protein